LRSFAVENGGFGMSFTYDPAGMTDAEADIFLDFVEAELGV
jgi:hypothetical protein